MASSGFGPSDVLKAGVLDRRGLVLGRWKRRFYILRDAFLFVCKEEPTSLDDGIAHPSHVIFLCAGPGGAPQVDCRESPSARGHPHVFTITVKQEEHVLSAPSAEERADWIQLINNSIKNSTEPPESEPATAAVPMRPQPTRPQPNSHTDSRVESRSTSRVGSPGRSPLSPSPAPSRSPAPSIVARTASPRSVTTRVVKPLLRGSSHSTLPASFGSRAAPHPAERADVDLLSQTLRQRKPSFLPAGDEDEDNFGALPSNSPPPLRSSQPESEVSPPTPHRPFGTNGTAPSTPSSSHNRNSSSVHASPIHASKTLSLISSTTGSSRSKVAALSADVAAAEQLRLDAFTLRTRSSILDGEDTDEFGADFSSQDLETRWDAPPSAQAERDLYDDDEHPQPPIQPEPCTPPPRDADPNVFAIDSIPPSPAPSHRRTQSAMPSPRTPRPGHAPTVSAVDDDTRLKLKQIEESSNDPELLALQAEHQVLDDKVAKLRLHRKVLTNELKSLLPRLGIQHKVNASYTDEIQFHKVLNSKRTAHRIQVCNWAQKMKMRLSRSEPSVFLKQQRRQSFHQVQPYVYATASYSSPNATAHRALSPSSGGALSPPSAKMVHSELVRLSTGELDRIEAELKSRRVETPSAHMITALEREEMLYVDADASTRPPDLNGRAAEEEWARQRPGSSFEETAFAAASVKSTSSAESASSGHGHDPHYLLLRSHTASLNDFTHLVAGVLLREVSIRRQLNLLQHSIYKLTSEKESSFRASHALASAAALMPQRKTKKPAKATKKR